MPEDTQTFVVAMPKEFIADALKTAMLFSGDIMPDDTLTVQQWIINEDNQLEMVVNKEKVTLN